MHTPCKDCCFAVYENNGITQAECRLNLIDKYINLGVKVVEVYDDDKEFYVVEGRKCLFYRTDDWFDDNYEEKLKEEMQIKYAAVIYIDENQSFEDAKPTILSLFNSSILPVNIIITYKNNSRQLSNKNNLPEYSEDLMWCQQNCQGVKFEIKYPTNNPSKHEALKIAINKCNNSFILLEAGKELNPQTIETINSKIVDDLYPIVAAKHSDNRYHELFAFKSLRDYVGGFGEKSIQEKIDKIIQDSEDKDKCQQTFLIYEQT